MSWGIEHWGYDPWGGGGPLAVSVSYPSVVPSNGGTPLQFDGVFTPDHEYRVYVGQSTGTEGICYSGVRGQADRCRPNASGTKLIAVCPPNLLGTQSARIVDLTDGTELVLTDVLTFVQPPGLTKLFRMRSWLSHGGYPSIGRRQPEQIPTQEWQT